MPVIDKYSNAFYKLCNHNLTLQKFLFYFMNARLDVTRFLSRSDSFNQWTI